MSSAIILKSPLVKPFNNSNTVAILASVGIHALVLGVAFPYLSSISKQESSDQTDVRLVELSPAEKSRLPDLSPPTPDITQFSSPSLGNTPLSDTPTINSTEIPPSIDSFATSSLPALPPLEGLQSTPSLPPLSSLPPMNIYSPPVASLPPAPPPNFQNLPSPPEIRTPELRSPQPYEPQESPFREENIRPNFQQPNNELTLDDLRKSPVVYGNQRRQEINQQQEIATLSDPRRIDRNLEEERQRRLRAELLREAQRLQASLQPDSVNTTDEEARRNYVEWLNQEEVKRKTLTPEVISIPGNAPRMVNGQLGGTSVYGVVVDSSGRVVDLRLIKSAGYPILNEQAKRDILARNFPNSTGGNQPYRISVSFNPAPNLERNLPQSENNPRNTQPSQQNTPNTPTTAPSSQPVQPSSQPTNEPPETQITQPNNTPDTPKQEQPVVEQSPTQEKTTPENQIEQPANNIQETQPEKPAVVEQSPLPENINPETISEPNNTPSSTQPSTVVEPPAAPASQKPNPSPEEPVSPPTSQKPANVNVEAIGPAAPKKPSKSSPEVNNNTPSGT